jgi:hypothetical protein
MMADAVEKAFAGGPIFFCATGSSISCGNFLALFHWSVSAEA